jgi:hypothetical protein
MFSAILADPLCHELGHMFGLVSFGDLFGSPEDFTIFIDDQPLIDESGWHNVIPRWTSISPHVLMNPFAPEPPRDQNDFRILPFPFAAEPRPLCSAYLTKLGLR